MARLAKTRGKRSGSKKRRALRRKLTGGQSSPAPLKDVFLLPGTTPESLVKAGLATMTPPSAWVALASGATLTLNKDRLNWDTPPSALVNTKGMFFGNSGVAQDGPVPIGTKPWSNMKAPDQIYFGAVNNTNGNHLKTHEFYISPTFSDGSKLSDALTKLVEPPSGSLNVNFTKSKITSGQKANYTVYACKDNNNKKECILISLSNNKGTPNASEVVLQISTYMLGPNGNICIQWTPPSISQNNATGYVGPILSSTGIANTSPYNVSVCLCSVGTNGNGVAPMGSAPTTVATLKA
jgi:hypothetical protein